MSSDEKVSIRPGVGVLSVLKHLNYKPWFALAEFVDNSIQSFIEHQNEIQNTDGAKTVLKVKIEFNPTEGGQLIIRDNAAGIDQSNYTRAFRPASTPLNTTGLSEFGMGMKSAACWFSPTWSVRTSALGEPVEKFVAFDISKVVQNELEELSVRSSPAPFNNHFTEIILTNLYQLPQKKTISKIKAHLASIYRVFIQQGLLELWYNDEVLTYQTPKILSAPFHHGESQNVISWRKDINFDFGEDLRVVGLSSPEIRLQ